MRTTNRYCFSPSALRNVQGIFIETMWDMKEIYIKVIRGFWYMKHQHNLVTNRFNLIKQIYVGGFIVCKNCLLIELFTPMFNGFV